MVFWQLSVCQVICMQLKRGCTIPEQDGNSGSNVYGGTKEATVAAIKPWHTTFIVATNLSDNEKFLLWLPLA